MKVDFSSEVMESRRNILKERRGKTSCQQLNRFPENTPFKGEIKTFSGIKNCGHFYHQQNYTTKNVKESFRQKEMIPKGNMSLPEKWPQRWYGICKY